MKNYLEQLIYALNESDIQKLKNIGFKKSRIKDYIDLLIEYREQGIPDKKYFLERLAIDDGGFRKMRTILLDQCLIALAPEGGIKIISLLGRYRLTELFIREVEVYKKKIEREKATDDVKAEFYWTCFKGYIRLPYTSFDIVEFSKITSGYLVAYHKPDKIMFDCIIQLNEIYIQIIQSFFSLEINDQKYSVFSKQLQNIEKFFSSVKSSRLNALAKGIRLILEFYFKPTTIELQNKLDELVIEYEAVKDEGISDELIAAKLYQAYNQLKLGNYTISLELFKQLEKEISNQLHEHPHVVFRYAQVLLINDKPAECKLLLDKYMKRYLRVFDQDTYVITCLIYSCYHLLNNEGEIAMDYISNCLSVIDKKTYLQKELLTRTYEFIYFLQKGDEKFCLILIKKFLRYTKSKKDIQLTQQVVLLMKIFQKNLLKLIKKKISLEEFENNINKTFNGQGAMTGKLFIHAARQFLALKNK